MVVLNEVLQIWQEEKHKVLIYTQTVSMLRILQNYAEEKGFSYCRMDGSTSVSKRQALVDMFNSRSDIFLFLLTTRVGGVGINLIGADRVILYDPDWNPSIDIQARERCWRIGQKKPVTIYRLITSGTIEEKIYHRQIFKTVLSNRVLGEGRDLCSFTSTNLNDLFTYSKRQRGTETGDIFPQGEILPEDVIDDDLEEGEIRDNIAESASVEDEGDGGEISGEGDRKVISCLFNHHELRSVFNHDFAFNNTDIVTASRMDREAREEAEQLQRQMRDSQEEYMQENPLYSENVRLSLGADRDREAEMTSADIIRRLKERKSNGRTAFSTKSKDISPSHVSLANHILYYFRARKDHSANTDSVLSYFKQQVKNDEKYLFRRLLKCFASLSGDWWTLKDEWI